MKQNGIDGVLLDWTENYLVNRTHKVFRLHQTNHSRYSAGFSYGSSVFLLYVNGIVEHLLSITRLFADDTSLAFTSSRLADLEGVLNHDLRITSSWARPWLVDFNPSKTIAMLFTLEKILIILHFYLTPFM